MDSTNQERIDKAVEIMSKLGLYRPYVNAFKTNGTITMYERGMGYYLGENEKDLQDKITEIENKHNVKVYAVTHEMTEVGEFYDLYIIPNDKDDWDYIFTSDEPDYLYCYCWNKSEEVFSEFGDVGVKNLYGGLYRVL